MNAELTTSHASPKNPLFSPAMWRLTRLLLSICAILLVNIVSYFWAAFSFRLLIRFDLTGIDPGTELPTVPIDYTTTTFCCLSLGWIVALGIFVFAFTVALIVYRRPWPLKMLLAATPTALVAYQCAFTWDLHPWVRPVCMVLSITQLLLAVLAAVLCRLLAVRLLPYLCPAP